MKLRWEDKVETGEYILYIDNMCQFSLRDVNVFHKDWMDYDKKRFGPYEYSCSLTEFLTMHTIKADTLEEAKKEALTILFEYYDNEIKISDEYLKCCRTKAQLIRDIINK